jgi:hypothetical protein
MHPTRRTPTAITRQEKITLRVVPSITDLLAEDKGPFVRGRKRSFASPRVTSTCVLAHTISSSQREPMGEIKIGIGCTAGMIIGTRCIYGRSRNYRIEA